MNQLQILTQLTEVAVVALEAKKRQLRPVLRRAVLRRMNLKQAEVTEKDLQRALAPMFEKQIKRIATGLKAAGGKEETELLDKGGSGSGNFGHGGRPGHVGGSGGGGGSGKETSIDKAIALYGTVLAQSTQDGYTLRIHASYNPSDPHDEYLPPKGQMTIESPNGQIVQGAYWMDWAEPHYPRNYESLSREDGASLEVEEQKKYGYKQAFEYFKEMGNLIKSVSLSLFVKSTSNLQIKSIATSLINKVFDQEKATEELVNSVMPILAIRMAEAARNQMISLGVDPRRKAKGGPGSGNFGHGGRPGEVGGSGTTIVLHGTTSKVLSSILTNGLIPGGGHGGKRVWKQLTTGKDRGRSIYVLDTKKKTITIDARDMYDVASGESLAAARMYAQEATKRGEQGIIIVARVLKSTLKQDEVGGHTSLEGGKSAKRIEGSIDPKDILGYVKLPEAWTSTAPKFHWAKKNENEWTVVCIPILIESSKSTSILQTKSTATEWLTDNPKDVAKLEKMLAGLDLPYTVFTELPPWMKQDIVKNLNDSFKQDYWEKISEATAGDAEMWLEQGLQEGYSIREMAQQMAYSFEEETGQYALRRAENIARTEAGNALNGARKGVMDQLQADLGDRVPMKSMWLSVLGNTTRDSHAALDGVPADENGNWYLGGVNIPWPGHWSLPPEERCNCFPEDVLVQGVFVGAQRGWYDGPLVKIITAGGTQLSLTPNHPVMTTQGFVSASKLRPGDQVLSYQSQVNGSGGNPSTGSKLPASVVSFEESSVGALDDSIGKFPLNLPFSFTSNDENNKPPSIKQVFEAFLEGAIASNLAFNRKVKVSAMEDFYGDGKSIQGNIDIVRTNWKLLKDGKIGKFEKRGDSIFVSKSEELLVESGSGSGLFAGQGIGPTPPTFPSLAEPLGNCLVFVADILPSGALSIGKLGVFDAQFSELGLYGPQLYSRFFRELFQGSSLKKLSDQGVDIGNGEIIGVPIPKQEGGFGSGSDVDSSLNEQGFDIDPAFFGKCCERFSQFISPDEVIEVSVFYYSGYVYDLQSEDRFIIAGNPNIVNSKGIVTSNCQCSIITQFGMMDAETIQLIQDYNDRIDEESVNELQTKIREQK